MNTRLGHEYSSRTAIALFVVRLECGACGQQFVFTFLVRTEAVKKSFATLFFDSFGTKEAKDELLTHCTLPFEPFFGSLVNWNIHAVLGGAKVRRQVKLSLKRLSLGEADMERESLLQQHKVLPLAHKFSNLCKCMPFRQHAPPFEHSKRVLKNPFFCRWNC
jgi:hypothetical protein